MPRTAQLRMARLLHNRRMSELIFTPRCARTSISPHFAPDKRRLFSMYSTASTL